MISVFYSNHDSYKDLHLKSVLRYCRKKENKKFKESKLNSAVLLYFGTIVRTYSEFLSAAPEVLFLLKNEFDSFHPSVQSEINRKLGAKGLYNRFTNNVDAFEQDDGSIYNSTILASKLDILSCPYCNENYTYSFLYSTKSQIRRSYDWDHIIPQGKYPIFAICFNNLVPSCKVCNNLKLDEVIYINPYQKFNVDDHYKYQAKADVNEFKIDSKSIKLDLSINSDDTSIKIGEVMKLVGMDKRFESQREMIKDLLSKKSLYQSEYWKSWSEQLLKSTSLSETDLNQIFWGTYVNYQNYFKRPYSKLVKDILN